MQKDASIANQTQSSPAALANGAASAYETSESETLTIERLPVQLKLSVGAPNDPLEYEADAMADKVMRMPESSFIQRKSLHENNAYDDEHVRLKPLGYHQPSFLQRCACDGHDDEHVQLKPMGQAAAFILRKSSCSCGDYDDEHIHLKPLVNQITPFVQAKSDGGVAVNDSVSNQIRSTMGGGNSMPGGTKSFMENRFGTDFSDVKIHTGSESAQLSQALNAKAFTLSNNIYFNSGQYQPDTSSGKHLLAHELTHIVQQGGTAGQNVQRAVSPKMGEIRDRLTYGLFDWAITDSNVHDVLVDLQALIPLDLRDTVAVMEKEGLVTRLYDNLAESAERTKPFVPVLMQQVQDARFVKGGGNGSCNAKQTAQSGSALGKIKEWANTTIDVLSDFEIGIDPVKSARVGKLLDKYFFHEAQAGVLSAAQRINFVRIIIGRIKTMRDKAAGTIINCASPFDLTCSGGGAIAYVSRGNPSVLRVCSIFFNDSAGSQIATTFHELMHFYNPQVDDTGYRHERIFEYLPPDRAVNNADSYSTFAMEIVLGEKAAAKELRSGRDSVQGCNSQQETNLRREIAFATRMIQNAVNQIDDSYAVQNNGNFASVNFHSTNHQDLIKFVERFHAVQNSIPNRIFFHCNVASAQTTGALPFIDNSGLTLTQPYFSIASENNRVANLLAILFRKYSSGMTAAIWPSAPAYAIQTLNQAYTNPAAYASYAQGVSFNSTAWNFADADVRYREEIQRTLERVRTEFNESFDDSEFKTHITDNIITYFANQLQAVHFTNHAQLDSGTTTLLQKITIIRALTDRMYQDYTRVNNDNFFTGLMTFDGSIFTDSRLYRVFDFSYNRALIDLSASFGPILVRIDNGEAIKFADWTDYPALLTKYQTESRNSISVMPTYKNYLKKLNAAKETYDKSSEKIKNSPAIAGLSLGDSLVAHVELLTTNTAFKEAISKIEDSITIEIMHGRHFNPRNPDLPASETLLPRFESQLRKIVPASKLRVHKKLSVGAVNDPLEYEADAMADKVMKTPGDQTIQRKSSCSCNDYDDEHIHLKPLADQVTPFIQAKGDEGGTVSDSVSNRIKSTMGGGDPIPNSAKSFMENRFGADFSHVKIHTGDESIQLSQELNAKAFTAGNNIYFNSGQYQPNTDAGKHLLAHELTHTVQQSGDINKKGVQRVPADNAAKKPVKGALSKTSKTLKKATEAKPVNNKSKLFYVPEIEIPSIKKDMIPGATDNYTFKKTERSDTHLAKWNTAVTKGGNFSSKFKSKVKDELPGEASAKNFFMKLRSESAPSPQAKNKKDGVKQLITGNEIQIRDTIARPFWDNDGKSVDNGFDVDHKVELQMGGLDDIGNLWLLDAATNRSSGSRINDNILRAITNQLKVNSDEPEDKKTDPDASDVKNIKDNYAITAGTLRETDLGGETKGWELKQVQNGEHLESLSFITQDDPARKKLVDSNNLTLILSQRYGVTKYIKWDAGKASKDITDDTESRAGFIKSNSTNLKLKKISYKNADTATISSSGSTGEAEIEALRDNKFIVPGISTKLSIDAVPGLYGGRLNVSSAKQEISSKLKAAGLSPIEIEELDINDTVGLIGSGKIITDVPLIKGSKINLVFDEDGVKISKVFKSGEINIPKPFKVTDTSLEIFASTSGIGIKGEANFEISKLGKGKLGAKAGVTGAFSLTGSFDFDSKTFNPARIEASYTNDGFSASGEIGIPENTIRGLKTANVKINYANEKFDATGTAEFSIKGIKQAGISVSYDKNQLVIAGSFELDNNIPGIKSGRGNLRVTQNENGKFRVHASGQAEPNIPRIDTSLSITYDDGALTMEGRAAYKNDRLAGDVTVGATNRTVNADGVPSGPPGNNFTVYGNGSLTVKLTDWLQGTAKIRLTPAKEIEVVGRLEVPKPVEIFPRKSINKTLFTAPTIEIPIFAIPVGPRSIGLVATINGGLDFNAGIGPGQLTDVFAEIKYNPSKPKETTLKAGAKVGVPANAGIVLHADLGIGASIAIASVTGGIEIRGGLGLEGNASAQADLEWSPENGLKFDALGEIEVHPKFTFDINALLRGSLNLGVTSYSKEYRHNLKSFSFGPDMQVKVSMPVHYKEGEPFNISKDDIQVTYPKIDIPEMAHSLANKIKDAIL